MVKKNYLFYIGYVRLLLPLFPAAQIMLFRQTKPLLVLNIIILFWTVEKMLQR